MQFIILNFTTNLLTTFTSASIIAYETATKRKKYLTCVAKSLFIEKTKASVFKHNKTWTKKKATYI